MSVAGFFGGISDAFDSGTEWTRNFVGDALNPGARELAGSQVETARLTQEQMKKYTAEYDQFRRSGTERLDPVALRDPRLVSASPISFPNSVTTERVGSSGLGDAAQTRAVQANAAGTGPTSLMDAATVQRAVTGRASQVDGIERVAGRDVQGPGNISAALGNAGRMDAANVDGRDAAAVRARQESLLTQLEDAAAGKTPSAAEMMLQRQTQKNLAQQFALASGARGAGIPMALRNAQNKTSEINQEAAYQAGVLRAQEQERARGQLGTILGQTRDADQSLALARANLEQDAGKMNLDVGTRVGLANQQALNTANLTSADMNLRAGLANQDNALRAGLANQSAFNQMQLSNAQMQNAQQLANMDALNQNARLNAQFQQQAFSQNATSQNEQQRLMAQLGTQTSLANMQASNQVGLANMDAANTRAALMAQMEQQRNFFNSGQAFDASKINSDALMRMAMFNSDQYRQVDMANMQAANAYELARAGLNLDVDKTNIANQFQTRAMDDAYLAALRNASLGAASGASSALDSAMARNAQNNAAVNSFVASMIDAFTNDNSK